jgi:hypothetical protein
VGAAIVDVATERQELLQCTDVVCTIEPW